MASSKELPKTSQPSLMELEEILAKLTEKGYTHALGLFLSSGISGFYQNIQYLADEFEGLTVAFQTPKITSAPLGMMVENVLKWADAGLSFEEITGKLDQEIGKTTAFIMVDDLNHLVKGGRLSNGAALLGNLLSIKPILYFTGEGKIEVYEKFGRRRRPLNASWKSSKNKRPKDSIRLLSYTPTHLRRLKTLNGSWKKQVSVAIYQSCHLVRSSVRTWEKGSGLWYFSHY